MFKLSLYYTIFLLLTLPLISCYEKDNMVLCHDDNYVMIRVERFGKKFENQYLYAFGLGKDTQKINYQQFERSSTLMDTVFILPLNLNIDTSIFCLLRKDMSIDTFGVTYNRSFSIHKYCGYEMRIRNLKPINLSERIYKDSVSFNYSNYRTASIRIYLKLRK